jgi:hypothetical protein
MGGIVRGSIGLIAGRTIGHIRGAQIGLISSVLEQIGSTSPFTQRHTQSACAVTLVMRTKAKIKDFIFYSFFLPYKPV